MKVADCLVSGSEDSDLLSSDEEDVSEDREIEH